MLTYSCSPDIMVILRSVYGSRMEYPSDAHAARLRSAALSVLLCAPLRVGKCGVKRKWLATWFTVIGVTLEKPPKITLIGTGKEGSDKLIGGVGLFQTSFDFASVSMRSSNFLHFALVAIRSDAPFGTPSPQATPAHDVKRMKQAKKPPAQPSFS
ncbi:hypothetical protein BDZ45DRAFT_750168 [Acephala macrosclerotiorum]|nr:hypothetical protein BDZ45DRAFT_750168 [Acephala macrosclerotiorum]